MVLAGVNYSNTPQPNNNNSSSSTQPKITANPGYNNDLFGYDDNAIRAMLRKSLNGQEPTDEQFNQLKENFKAWANGYKDYLSTFVSNEETLYDFSNDIDEKSDFASKFMWNQNENTTARIASKSLFNENGAVDYEGYKASLKSIADASVTSMDSDGDGKVSVEEYASFNHDQTKDNYVSRVIDVDNDGIITADEMAAEMMYLDAKDGSVDGLVSAKSNIALSDKLSQYSQYSDLQNDYKTFVDALKSESAFTTYYNKITNNEIEYDSSNTDTDHKDAVDLANYMNSKENYKNYSKGEDIKDIQYLDDYDMSKYSTGDEKIAALKEKAAKFAAAFIDTTYDTPEDGKKDGKVSLSEFLQYEAANAGGIPGEKLSTEQKKAIKQVFDTLDVDGDEELNAQEMATLMLYLDNADGTTDGKINYSSIIDFNNTEKTDLKDGITNHFNTFFGE